ncbi:Sas10/Utp3 family protein [Xylariales sp. PMI_506]|nr:Sas10/Utp3 family protein [Xylariales sp. PMI_506]
MGKKRKVSGGASQPKGPRDYDTKDARLGPINTFEDVADSEDEYFMNQDQILFNDGPKSKKQRRVEEEEEFMEPSDEEVLDYDDQDDEDDEEDELEELARKTKKATKKRAADAESEDEGEGEGEDAGWWGSSKTEYYNADAIQTEADALEEEQEARRLQKKKLAKMAEEDFIWNEDEWLADKPEEVEDNEVVTEVLKDVEITEDMSAEERMRILQSRYPELEYLAEELLELQPLLVTLQKEAEGHARTSVAVVKYRLLGCYVATLAMYFATLTSPARDGDGQTKALDPAALREHEVMGTLLECREAWQQVKDLSPSKAAEAAASIPSPPEEDSMSVDDDDAAAFIKPATKISAKEKAEKKKSKKAERQVKELEDSLADLSTLVAKTKKTKKAKTQDVGDDNKSDFGEEEVLDARSAAEKAARKKSLRFYTSQIVQKANKRAGAGRDAGGDMDIPYRERLRDRQARLNAEAEKRGQKTSKHGAELGDDSDEDDNKAANNIRDDEDEYYDLVAARTNKKKSDKAARAEALSKVERVVETEEIGEDGKRKITYQIEKNKGLAPKRKKEVRNGRVKKRKQFDDKQKKLRSMRAVYKGGEGKGGYSGELTGIKPGLIKSIKL